jgi:hypothetical protein
MVSRPLRRRRFGHRPPARLHCLYFTGGKGNCTLAGEESTAGDKITVAGFVEVPRHKTVCENVRMGWMDGDAGSVAHVADAASVGALLQSTHH